jgi:hypothetical protein
MHSHQTMSIEGLRWNTYCSLIQTCFTDEDLLRSAVSDSRLQDNKQKSTALDF